MLDQGKLIFSLLFPREKTSPITHSHTLTMPAKSTSSPKTPRTKSAYQFFCGDKRAVIKKDNPDASFGETQKLLGAAWKTLTKNQKEKYEKMASDAKNSQQQPAPEPKTPKPKSSKPKTPKSKTSKQKAQSEDEVDTVEKKRKPKDDSKTKCSKCKCKDHYRDLCKQISSTSLEDTLKEVVRSKHDDDTEHYKASYEEINEYYQKAQTCSCLAHQWNVIYDEAFELVLLDDCPCPDDVEETFSDDIMKIYEQDPGVFRQILVLSKIE